MEEKNGAEQSRAGGGVEGQEEEEAGALAASLLRLVLKNRAGRLHLLSILPLPPVCLCWVG